MTPESFIPAEDLAKHAKPGELWLLIHGKVYDVSTFMSSHPGGAGILLAQAVQDSTGVFDDVGHSDEAIKLMNSLLIGTLKHDSTSHLPSTTSPWTGQQRRDGAVLGSASFTPIQLFTLPVVAIVFAALLFSLLR